MWAVSLGNRCAIFYSPDDITAGLLEYEWYGLRGYESETAVTMIANLLYNLSAGQSPQP